MKKFLPAILMICAFNFACANDDIKNWNGWVQRDGTLLPDSAFRKSSQGFGALLVLANDPQFFKKWDTNSEIFEYATMEKVKKDVYFIISIIFINPGADKKNQTNIKFDVKIIKPDGSVYAHVQTLNGWNREAPKTNILGLSEGYLTVKMEPEDSFGLYRVEAIVHDKIKNVTLILSREYLVEE